MARTKEGLTKNLYSRIQPQEFRMLRDIAVHLQVSENKGIRWAIRYAWHHAIETGNHLNCPGDSPCAAAHRAIHAPAHPPTPDNHETTVEEPK